jgi:CheY-like chemotaxis protein
MEGKIKKCWIIDDDPIFIYGTKRIMKEVHFSNVVDVYHNGQDALEKLNESLLLKEAIPDIILLDLNMPIMNGWEFLDQFMALLKTRAIAQTQIFVVSSSVDPRDLKKVNDYSVVKGYISKPITPNDLESILGKVPIT